MADTAPDRQSIADQLAEYGRTFDARDVDGWVALFTGEGIFESRLDGREAPLFRMQGAEELRAFATTAPHVLHHITGLVFDELLLDTARTRAVVLATWNSPSDGSPAIFSHGTYEHRWSKIDGVWLLAEVVYFGRGYSRESTR
jgi:hypothetical protein